MGQVGWILTGSPMMRKDAKNMIMQERTTHNGGRNVQSCACVKTNEIDRARLVSLSAPVRCRHQRERRAASGRRSTPVL
ncbi:hypothetical protein EVAR_95637_1 [Eumeta japonica]|uniref:Uncharacterized protein n=1 Tax=Eumeta variegata TaxID=151549 RepID=A0A4C1SVD5_EUMVA|nr:hypothetical protein EVAR_95637_1 [Eumeta japonica]